MFKYLSKEREDERFKNNSRLVSNFKHHWKPDSKYEDVTFTTRETKNFFNLFCSNLLHLSKFSDYSKDCFCVYIITKV